MLEKDKVTSSSLVHFSSSLVHLSTNSVSQTRDTKKYNNLFIK